MNNTTESLLGALSWIQLCHGLVLLPASVVDGAYYGRRKVAQSDAMPLRFGSPKFWQKRAEEARVTAETMTDPEVRQAMLGIARSYEKLAKRAEAREAGVDMSQNPPCSTRT